jgi:hypothetical protein
MLSVGQNHVGIGKGWRRLDKRRGVIIASRRLCPRMRMESGHCRRM